VSKGDAATLPTPVWGGSMGSLAQQGTTPSQPSMPVPGQYDGTGGTPTPHPDWSTLGPIDEGTGSGGAYGTPDVFGGAYSSQPAQTTPAVTPPQQQQSTPSGPGINPNFVQSPGFDPMANINEGPALKQAFDEGMKTLSPQQLSSMNQARDRITQLLTMLGGGRQL
jgi:hypothetical protein